MENHLPGPRPRSPLPYAVAVVAVVAALAWAFWPADEVPAPAAPVARVEAPVPPPAVPEHHPAPVPPAAGPDAAPLPALDASDASVLSAFAALLGTEAAGRFLRPESLVRRIVATVDNLPRRGFAQRLNPAHPVGGLLVTEGAEETLVLSAANAARYAPWVRLVERVDTKRAVALYARHYPLFQQAYEELGYPGGHFNTRLVQVIDHLLATPVPPRPVRLVVRRVLPEFADPALEAESAGRKVLMRLGEDNAAAVKAKLAALRRELVAAAPARAGP